MIPSVRGHLQDQGCPTLPPPAARRQVPVLAARMPQEVQVGPRAQVPHEPAQRHRRLPGTIFNGEKIQVQVFYLRRKPAGQ